MLAVPLSTMAHSSQGRNEAAPPAAHDGHGSAQQARVGTVNPGTSAWLPGLLSVVDT